MPKTDLLVIKVVDEGGEASGLVLHRKRQPGNVPNKHGVEVLRHFQVVAGTQGLDNTDGGGQGVTDSPLSGQHKLPVLKRHVKNYAQW